MLRVVDLVAGYGKMIGVTGLGFVLPSGKALALTGANGAGKSTALKAIAGLLPHVEGNVVWETPRAVLSLRGLPPESIARAGLFFVPESNSVFTSLSVQENLALSFAAFGLSIRRQAALLEVVFDEFETLGQLRQQQARTLSGGEARLLGIARAVAGAVAHDEVCPRGPKVLMIDEATSGLSPAAIERIGHALQKLRQRGWSMLLAEQMLGFAIAHADEIIVMSAGTVVKSVSTANFAEGSNITEDLLRRILQVTEQPT